MKKRQRITGILEQNIKKEEGSKMKVVGITVKDKISEKTKQSAETDKEARKCKHRDRTRHMECSTNQNSMSLIKDSSKKHRMIDVKPQQLQQSIHTKKINHAGDLLQRNVAADSNDNVKKVKLCDSDRKLDQTYEDVKLQENNLVEYQEKRSKEELQHHTRMKQMDNYNKLQLVERHQKAREYTSRKLNKDAKIEEAGSSKEITDRIGRRAGVDKYYCHRRQECSSDSARQHVCRALYRALLSR